MSNESKGKAATRAKNKWQSSNCDRINLVVPKGKKTTYRAVADSVGESLNGYIIRAVEERMERDTKTRE